MVVVGAGVPRYFSWCGGWWPAGVKEGPLWSPCALRRPRACGPTSESPGSARTRQQPAPSSYPFEDCKEAQTREGGGWTPAPQRSALAGIKLCEELTSGTSQGRGRGSEARWFECRYQFTDTCLGDLSVVLPVDLGSVRGSVEHYL